MLVRKPFAPAFCVNDFRSRDDLIEACLASAHVPLFMDGALTATFREGRYVDDDWMGLRRKQNPALVLPAAAESVRIAVGRDPRVRDLISKPGGTMRLMSREAISELMDWGSSNVEARDAEGAFEGFEGLRRH